MEDVEFECKLPRRARVKLRHPNKRSTISDVSVIIDDTEVNLPERVYHLSRWLLIARFLLLHLAVASASPLYNSFPFSCSTLLTSK